MRRCIGYFIKMPSLLSWKLFHVILVFILNSSFFKVHCICLQRPHVIFIYADDLGWNDVSFHGSPQIPTPNLDALAASGIMLNNYYSDSLCTPSRGALMTGKYPIRLGLQHFVIRCGEATALPIEMEILPQYLKKLGYATHMVGKWHLGSMKKKYTPTERGFDTFFGCYNGFIDYYDYVHQNTDYDISDGMVFSGIDLHNGTHDIRDFRGQYATTVFTEKATNLIHSHNSSEPMFLFLSHTAPHTGPKYNPFQAPPEIVKKFSYIKDTKRRTYAAMVSAFDDSVGTVFQALHEKGMLSHSIVIFASDNGGDIAEHRNGIASNFPLRGSKFQFWEGAVRVPALIWSPLLNMREGRVSNQLMHVTDWLPTLYSAAGGNVADLGEIDGHDMWDAFLKDSPSTRSLMLHTINPIANMSALRFQDLKIIKGNFDTEPTWYSTISGKDDLPPPSSMDEWVYSKGSVTKDILEKIQLYLPQTPDTWRLQSEVSCDRKPDNLLSCNPMQSPCLFNITEDPCETTNIADSHPEVIKTMLNILEDYEKQAVKPQFKNRDPKSDPRCHNFAFVPWLDKEHVSDCPFE